MAALVMTVIVMATLSIRHHAFGRSAGGPRQPTVNAKAATPGVVAQTATPSRADAAIAPAAMAAPPPASPSDLQIAQCQRDYTAWVSARATALENSSAPRDRLGAALLQQTVDGSGITELSVLEDVTERAPNDALAAWLHATRCSSDKRCDQDAAIEHLLRVEPDNAAAWLMPLDAAMRRGDIRLAETLLHKVAAAPRIDGHWGETALLAAQSIGTPPTTPACAQSAVAMGENFGLDGPATPADMATVTAGALPQLPAMAGVLRLCPPRQAIPKARLPACRSMFRLMAQSDLLIFSTVGLRGLSVHADPADRGEWLRQLRDAEWMQRKAVSLYQPRHARLAWEQGEVPVMTALLQEAGRWPAPDDWQAPTTR